MNEEETKEYQERFSPEGEYIQYMMEHPEISSIECQWENCSGGEYCEKHSLLIKER